MNFTAHGGKVVRYCFLNKRAETRRLMPPGSELVGKSARDATEEQLKSLLVRNVMGADRWYQQHTTWQWMDQI